MAKKLIDPNRLCPGCMKELAQGVKICPYCGFDPAAYQRPKYSLPLQEILAGKYLLGRVIGIGGFGITYIGWDFYQSRKVCIKEYFPRAIAIRHPDAETYLEKITVSVKDISMYTHNPSRAGQAYTEGLRSYIKEAENLSRFYGMPGVVSVRDFFYGNNTAYIVMEYIDGIDLRRYRKIKGGRIRPDELFAVLKDVFLALSAVHEAGIIHRDISPDNIMLTPEGRPKLIDFGAARNYRNARYAPILLKRGYAPIEQYQKKGRQGPWTDVYSLCATIYYLLSGVRIPPAPQRLADNRIELLQVLGVPVSEEQDMAIQRGLQVMPQDRFPTIDALYHALYGEVLRHYDLQEFEK